MSDQEVRRGLRLLLGGAIAERGGDMAALWSELVQREQWHQLQAMAASWRRVDRVDRLAAERGA